MHSKKQVLAASLRHNKKAAGPDCGRQLFADSLSHHHANYGLQKCLKAQGYISERVIHVKQV